MPGPTCCWRTGRTGCTESRIYKGRPILYSPGNFAFELEQIECYPSDYYERLGLGPEATPEDVRRAETAGGTKGYPAKPEVWQGFAAVLRFEGDRLRELRAIPLDLGFGQPLPVRGMPRYADAALGRRITDDLDEASRPYGTRIRHLDDENAAIVELP